MYFKIDRSEPEPKTKYVLTIGYNSEDDLARILPDVVAEDTMIGRAILIAEKKYIEDLLRMSSKNKD